MVEPVIIIAKDSNVSFDESMTKEWLVTNGLGGYASGSVPCINTRRHHGLFIPNLSYPRGRTMLLPYLEESVTTEKGTLLLGQLEFKDQKIETASLSHLKEFRLDWQTPTWIYELPGYVTLEKKIFMPYCRNTVYVSYRLLQGHTVQLKFRPYCACRKHDHALGYTQTWPFTVISHDEFYEIFPFEEAPAIRLALKPFGAIFSPEPHLAKDIFYRVEFIRGLDSVENLYSPGFFTIELNDTEPVYFMVTTHAGETLKDDPRDLYSEEMDRRRNLLSHLSKEAKEHLLITQLTLAADQFIILPRSRNEKNVLMQSTNEQAETMIAGYHWFTDWGRDTMISLEGLTLCTGRPEEARAILQTFGHYVKNGLLPNHFPEGECDAIYNTVDATFWYFHALDRYFEYTKDKEILELLYPTLQLIFEYHIKGTDFGIHMDPKDNLIYAAAEGYQLTWMDAKVDEWVVTPRRGKPVEIQALWYNALKLMEQWSEFLEKPAKRYSDLAQKVYQSFNTRFWCDKEGYLYDVIDTNKGDDANLRPNQIMAVSLRFPVLEESLWKPIVDIVDEELLTPFGLRSLNRANKDYHSRYDGNRWERDAAYHQGLVWAWLIGPFLDAWKKVYKDEKKGLEFLRSFEFHLREAGIGTISEIFDAQTPYTPRGCISQAWSVAEVLRCFINLSAVMRHSGWKLASRVTR